MIKDQVVNIYGMDVCEVDQKVAQLGVLETISKMKTT